MPLDHFKHEISKRKGEDGSAELIYSESLIDVTPNLCVLCFGIRRKMFDKNS